MFKKGDRCAAANYLATGRYHLVCIPYPLLPAVGGTGTVYVGIRVPGYPVTRVRPPCCIGYAAVHPYGIGGDPGYCLWS